MLAALVDDFSPTALEPREVDVRVFFASTADRDAAERALAGRYDLSPIDVDDNTQRRGVKIESMTLGLFSIAS